MPDITFDVGVLSRFMHQPKETHWLVVIRVLAYIKNCPGKGVVYRKHGHVHIYGYSDSRYENMLVTEKIESLLLGIAPFLEEIW